MKMKGLFEWKILAAIFAVLIVASSAAVSNTGLGDIFMNSTGDIGGWLDNSPLSSLFSTPEKETRLLTIEIRADMIPLRFDRPVNISASGTEIKSFTGDVEFNFIKNMSRFMPGGSSMVIESPLSETLIKDAAISRLVLSDVDFSVMTGKANISVTGDRIEFQDFSGDITANGMLTLSGNFSRVKNEQWSVG